MLVKELWLMRSRKRSFSAAAYIFWNILPPEVRKCPTLVVFQKCNIWLCWLVWKSLNVMHSQAWLVVWRHPLCLVNLLLFWIFNFGFNFYLKFFNLSLILFLFHAFICVFIWFYYEVVNDPKSLRWDRNLINKYSIEERGEQKHFQSTECQACPSLGV